MFCTDRCSNSFATATWMRRNFLIWAPCRLSAGINLAASLGGPIKKNRLFLFGNYEGFRQALAESSVSEVPDQYARLGLLPNAQGVYTTVSKLNPAMLKYFTLWPNANGPELFSNGVASGVALAYYNPRQHIQEDFGTTRSDYAISDRDTLTAAYTIDNGTNLTPAADPLFASDLIL